MGIFNWFKKTDDSKIKMSENLSDDEKIVITIDQVKVSSTKTMWGEIVDFFMEIGKLMRMIMKFSLGMMR